MRAVDSTGIGKSDTDRVETGIAGKSRRHRPYDAFVKGSPPAPCLAVCGEPTRSGPRLRDADERVIPDDPHRLGRVERVPIRQLAGVVVPPAASFSREGDCAG